MSVPTSALEPVSAALYAALNVASFTALSTGGVMDDVAQNTGAPFTLYEVQERWLPSIGVKAGTGRVMEITVRLHVYSQQQSYREAELIVAEGVRLLASALTVTGYAFCGEPIHEATLPLGDQLVAGLKVKELLAIVRFYVQEVGP